jgi:hypothetical protein
MAGDVIPKIEGAILYDLMGIPRRIDDILFIPVLLDFNTPIATSKTNFFDAEALQSATMKRAFDLYGGELYQPIFKSLWLRSQITRIFHFQPIIAGDR